MPSQNNITNIPSSRVDFIDQRTGLMSREWYRFFLNLFNLTGAGNNPTSLDDLQVGPPTGSGEGGNSGTVTSVQVSGGTTGLTTSGGPITSAGTITLAGTLAVANGGTGSGTAGGARTNLGATTVGSNLFTLTNPSAVTFPRFNADNTVSALDATSFRTAIGAGTGGGSVTSVAATAGTGIAVTGSPITTSGTLNITNTAPDQTVVLTAGTGISTSGTYPNFTITNTSPSSGGTVTSVGTAGTVNGLTLTGGPITSTGTVTLGGTLDLSSPPTIGNTTPNTGKFTTLESTGIASLGTASTTYVRAIGDASYPGVYATGGTNTPLVLQPLGTGALQAQKTDSTATGGNARGANAVDWQTSRNTASQVASGYASVIAGGGNYGGGAAGNTSSGTATFIGGGWANTASVQAALVAGGNNNTASNVNASVLGGSNNAASGVYSSIVGGQGSTTAGYYNFVGGGFTNSATSGSAVTTQSGTMNATTAVTLSGSNANIKVGQLITGTSIASYTYVAAISGTSLTLSQNASGSSTSTLSFYTPHGIVVGGGNNQATGSYSFIGGGGDAGTAANRNVASGDWSTVVGGRNNTVSGSGSFLGGGGYYAGLGSTNNGNTISGDCAGLISGIQNNASGFASFIGAGQGNIANSSFSTSLGAYGSTRGIQGYIALSASYTPIGTFVSASSQGGLLILGRQTTDATPTVLTSNTSAASGINQVILPNNSAYYFKGSVIAGVTAAGNTKSWSFEGTIKRGANAASTALVGTPVLNLISQDTGASTWVVAVTADTTNGGIAVTVTGQAATTIRWVAKIETTEMTY
jgi:hypothetical protein